MNVKRSIFCGFFILILLSGCGIQSTQKQTDHTQKMAEDNTEKEDRYQITYDKALFKIPDKVYSSEMIRQEVSSDQLFYALGISEDEIVKGNSNDKSIYKINNKEFRYDYGPICSSIYLLHQGKVGEKETNENLEEKAKTLFKKCEEITGVALDINNIRIEDFTGDRGQSKEFECSQIYRGIPLVGNFNMDNPFNHNKGEEPGEEADVVVNGSYCYASYLLDSAEWESVGIQNLFDEKEKVIVKDKLLTGDVIVNDICSYMKNIEFNGEKCEVKEASMCYIPLPAIKNGNIYRLTPCWQVLVSGRETVIENGQKKDMVMEWRFFVDAVSGYVYDVK